MIERADKLNNQALILASKGNYKDAIACLQRAVTIECASDSKSPYAFNAAVYDKLIKLSADICKRYGKKKLLWISDKTKALNYSPKDDEMILTVHRWF